MRLGDPQKVSVNWVIILPGNGLSPVQHQAIIRINEDLFSFVSLGKKTLVKFESHSDIYIQENVFDNLVCKMAAVLSFYLGLNVLTDNLNLDGVNFPPAGTLSSGMKLKGLLRENSCNAPGATRWNYRVEPGMKMIPR